MNATQSRTRGESAKVPGPLRPRVFAGLAALGLVVGVGGLGVVGATPASASSYGWDYISLPTWLGNCPGGGSVRYLWVSIGNTWSGSDGGDDLVYGRTVINENQTVVAQGLCYRGNQSYMGPAVSQTIRPTKSNQTWFVGPAGVTHN